MRYPWANIALLVLLAAELLTGFEGLISGADRLRWILWLHSIGAYAVLVVLFWKGQIIAQVLARRRLDDRRLAFLAMTGLALVVLGLGITWTIGGPRYVLGFSLMTLHAVLAVALAALLIWHTVARRFIFRVPYARDRRAFLRLAAVSVAGLGLWQGTRVVKAQLNLPGAGTRFTGSYPAEQLGYHLPGQFPVVSWLFDNPPPVAAAGWQLTVGGAVARPATYNYEQVRGLVSDTLRATIDCTGGWYSEQAWAGVLLGRLLDACGPRPTARSVYVEAVSGYSRSFDIAEAREFLLALAVGGQPLDHGHGFPARLVAPGHRGFEWVKWVTHIQVNETSPLLEPPLPLQ